MKRIISILLVIVLAMSMTACSKSRRTHKEEPEINIEEIKKTKGTMLEVHVIPSGEMTREEFESGSKTLKVTYAGAAINPNPVSDNGVMMSDEDYLSIYEFCLDCAETNKYADYKEDACDGTQYSFTYYDVNGQKHNLYSGYIYGDHELNRVVEIISKYSVD